ncbi:hypothetical protein B0H16DRAFT_1702798 [Mycena metata]|uniref:Uncharacterized protein n=1 Tax=Mycena metata TaxID=1033252 RepID=A0AAD7H699_9AGAR|nr:hypothetical protein B0H16DRAFT_1702798 [Mycena metata]
MRDGVLQPLQHIHRLAIVIGVRLGGWYVPRASSNFARSSSVTFSLGIGCGVEGGGRDAVEEESTAKQCGGWDGFWISPVQPIMSCEGADAADHSGMALARDQRRYVSAFVFEYGRVGLGRRQAFKGSSLVECD